MFWNVFRSCFHAPQQTRVGPQTTAPRTYLSEWTADAVRARNWDTFTKIMSTGGSVAIFKPFARGIGMEQMVTAWWEIQQFRIAMRTSRTVSHVKALHIFATYLNGFGTTARAFIEVNDLAEIKADVVRGVLHPDMFVSAEEVVLRKLFKEVYPRFVSTPEHRAVLAEIKRMKTMY